MKIRLIIERKFYLSIMQSFVSITSKIVDYLQGMNDNPKYMAIRYFFIIAPIPDISEIAVFLYLFFTGTKVF